MKKRFRILRLPFEFRSVKAIEKVFKVCCVLHNMLLKYEGRDIMGQLEQDWRELDFEDAVLAKEDRARRLK